VIMRAATGGSGPFSPLHACRPATGAAIILLLKLYNTGRELCSSKGVPSNSGWRRRFEGSVDNKYHQLYSTLVNFNLLAVVALVFSFRLRSHSGVELVPLSYDTVLIVRSTDILGTVSYSLSVGVHIGSTDQSCW